MVLEVLLLTLGVVAVIVGFVRLFAQASTTERERPVLPSHYSSLFHTAPQHYPGHCTNCGTDNEPGYRFCEGCGSQIPTTRDFSSSSDVREIFGE